MVKHSLRYVLNNKPICRLFTKFERKLSGGTGQSKRISTNCPSDRNRSATIHSKGVRIVKTAPEGAVFGVCLCDLPWRWGRIWRVRPTFSCYQLEFCSVRPCVWRGGREVPPQVGGLCARSMPSNVFSCPVLSIFASPLWALFLGWDQYCRDLRPRFVGQKKDEKNFAQAWR